MIKKVLEITNQNLQQVIKHRRFLHAHPEKGFEEVITSNYLYHELSKIPGFKLVKVAKTGIVATIYGTKPTNQPLKTIGFRADFDGLEIEDLKEVSYKSVHPGMCHACGHDLHASMLLGLASNLSYLQDQFSGCVKLFFQPAEETLGGALPMIDAGCLKDPEVLAVVGIHVSGNYLANQVRFCYDTMQASSTDVFIKVNGKGAHAAHPEDGVDGILVAAQIINNLQSVISRSISPLDSACLTFGKISGGTANNALASQVEIDGTLRTLTKEITNHLKKRIEEVCQGIALSYNAKVEVNFVSGYLPLVNNQAMVDFVKEVATKVVGKDNVIVNNRPSLGVEDFSYFADRVPSCFYNVGINDQTLRTSYPGHNGMFDAAEESMANGIAINTVVALEFLK